MELNELEKIVSFGESETVEFKKSTAQLTRAGETLCAFLNSQGGRAFVGVTPEGKIVGQQVADSTLREVAAMLARFEPPALISQERLRLPNGSEVLILSAPAVAGSGPFTFEARAYQRVGSTTSAMPQARYEALLLERAHGHSRWENAPASDVSPEDLTREHSSHPRNPFITEVFYRRGLIEQWGRGTNKIVALCTKAGLPKPVFGQQAGSVFVRFRPLAARTTATAGAESGAESGAEWELVLAALGVGEMSPVEVARKMGKSSVTGSLKRILRRLMAEKLIAQTIPDKPRSRLQKYRRTEKGKAMVASLVTDQAQPAHSEPSHVQTDQAPGAETGPKS